MQWQLITLAMQDASGVDLSQFKRWYEQAGTPELTVSDEFDAAEQVYRLTVKQSTPAPKSHFFFVNEASQRRRAHTP